MQELFVTTLPNYIRSLILDVVLGLIDTFTDVHPLPRLSTHNALIERESDFYLLTCQGMHQLLRKAAANIIIVF